MDPFMVQIQTNYLKDKFDKICNLDSIETSFVESLKEILRNQTPELWTKYPELYQTAIECCLQLNLYHSECMGRRNDKTSLLAALVDFATQAKFIMDKMPSSTSSDSTNNKELEALCLEVTNIANDTATFLESGGTTTLLASSTISGSSSSDSDGADEDETSSPTKTSTTVDISYSKLIQYIECNPDKHIEQYETMMRNMCFDITSCLKHGLHTYWTQVISTSSTSGSSGDASGAGGNSANGNGNGNTRNTHNPIDTTRLYRELATYSTQLPIDYGSSIFVRVSEQHVDLVRACIVGPSNTPYEHGLYFFDIYLKNYPYEPPKVTFLTTGSNKYRLNPNLYTCGKVCLSLLGTWSGPGWEPGKSTLLQVLVSIQSLILGVANPYYNEPGYEVEMGTPYGDRKSNDYNKKCRAQTLEIAILDYIIQMKNDTTTSGTGTCLYPEFNDIIQTHFIMKRHLIDTLFESHKTQKDKNEKKNWTSKTIIEYDASLYKKYHIAWLRFLEK